MAGSKFEYVRHFEADDALLRDTFIVVRVDGRGFSRFTAAHGFAKPNDVRGLALMNACAAAVMRDWGDAVLAYGVSDEYSFVFPRRAPVFGRRASKIATGVASLFAATYVFLWPRFFAGAPLTYPPAFDGRCVAYPTLSSVCDYVRWRQVDAHINALYNEAFWALVLRGEEGRVGRGCGGRRPAGEHALYRQAAALRGDGAAGCGTASIACIGGNCRRTWLPLTMRRRWIDDRGGARAPQGHTL